MGGLFSQCTKGDKFNDTLCYGIELPQRQGSKRSFTSRISSNSSSGISSACTSPSRRSLHSRCNTNSPISPKPTAKTFNFILTRNDMAIKEMKIQSICDDFGEGANMQQNNNTNSYGYYSESMSTGSGASSNAQGFVRTQDTSGLEQEINAPEILLPPSPMDLEMEMYMMYNSPCLMAKTSSPIVQRRNDTYDIGMTLPSSRSFQKWSNYLQKTPPYILNNITRIPEAIAGHFSPLDHPAYTDLEDMESAAKRFKIDENEDEVFYENQIPLPLNVTHTISTDL